MDQVVASSMAQEVALTYDYEPLDLTKQQIRLIALHPAADPSDPIRCDIRSFDMENGPHYIALSYTWGPVNPQQTILINGEGLSIRQNLYDFLHSYRDDMSNVHYLWIDQICISQAHEGERNHQVQLMSQIYSSSLSTIIWLGEISREVARRYQENRRIDDVCILFRNRYFSRLWVVQEIALSSHKRVLCGDIWVEFDDLINTATKEARSQFLPLELDNLQHLEDKYTGIFGTIRYPYPKILDNNPSHRKGHETLKECIQRFYNYACQDPRDKVYGILSLVREDDRLEVDYNKSTEEVFLQVVTSNAPWACVPPGCLQGDMFERPAGRFGDNMDVDSMVDLGISMRLHHDHDPELLRRFLMDIRDRWTGGSMRNFEAGFQRRTHQTTAVCPNLDHTEKGCCSDLWWFSLGGIKYYRDQGSYGGTFSFEPLSPWYYRRSAN